MTSVEHSAVPEEDLTESTQLLHHRSDTGPVSRLGAPAACNEILQLWRAPGTELGTSLLFYHLKHIEAEFYKGYNVAAGDGVTVRDGEVTAYDDKH